MSVGFAPPGARLLSDRLYSNSVCSRESKTRFPPRRSCSDALITAASTCALDQQSGHLPRPLCVLCGSEANALLALQSSEVGESLSVSIDLGRGTSSAYASDYGAVVLGATIPWAVLSKMSSRGGAWGVYGDGSVDRVCALGERAALSLYPIVDAPPTLLVGGFGMHRFAGDVNPLSDTVAKLNCARPIGKVLDVCTGLGYTAIGAAKMQDVSHVFTIERDPAVVEIQRLNPWSSELFSDAKIDRWVGDAVEVVRKLDDAVFDCVIHDPPALALAGDLYGLSFYQELRRVSRKGVRLYHYIGNPRSRESGRLYRGVANRLMEAGFNNVRMVEEAFGVIAIAGSSGADSMGAFCFESGRDSDSDYVVTRRRRGKSQGKGRPKRRW